jgi:hypothetical protein
MPEVNTCFEQLLHGDVCQSTSLCGLHPAKKPAVSSQLPAISEVHWKLATGNRQLHFRIAIPVHPNSGEVGG